jgi:hypothetical protein
VVGWGDVFVGEAPIRVSLGVCGEGEKERRSDGRRTIGTKERRRTRAAGVERSSGGARPG